MYIGIKKTVASHKAQLAASILVASVGTAAADERFPSNQYYGPYENNGRFVKPNPGLAPSRADADPKIGPLPPRRRRLPLGCLFRNYLS